MEARGDEHVEAQDRWQARPRLARCVRTVAMLAPMAASTLAVFTLSRLVGRPHSLGPQVLWWVGSLTVGSLVLVGTDRVARRLLPLAALLRLSLLFPDAAPSRFGLALRRGSLRHLEREPGAIGTTPTEAAAEMARLVAELQAHDRGTRGHAERVRAYSVMLGEEMGLSQHDADRLQWAALLHDIGKLSVPASILNKAGRLDDDEFAIIKNHPAEGDRMIAPLQWWLGPWTGAVGQHHERWDGKGYPNGLAATDISLAGRIVAVADAFDVITAARSYKRPLAPAVARAELTRCAGTQFDPDVVRAFLSVSLGGLRRIMGPLSWLTNVPVLSSVTAGAGAPIASVSTTLASVSTAAALGVASAAVIPANLTAWVLGSRTEPVTSELIGADATQFEVGPATTEPRHETTRTAATVEAALLATAPTTAPATTTTTTLVLTTPPSPTTTTTQPPTTNTTTLPTTTTTTAPPPPTTTTTTTTVPTTTVPPTTTTVPPTTTTVPPTTTTVPPTTTTTVPPTTTTTVPPATTTTVPPATTTTTVPTTTTTVPPTTTTTAPDGLAAVDDNYAGVDSEVSTRFDVLANDSGPGPLEVISFQQLAASGFGFYTLDIESRERIRFNPFGTYVGQARFSYTVRDALGGTATAIVTVYTGG